MRPTLLSALSKRIVIPRLSPTHSSSRVVKFIKPLNNDDYVESYDPIMILECSKDLIADPADRKHEEERLHMIIETCDEGTLQNLNDYDGKWLDVGTPIGNIDDGESIDGDWTWQAYLFENESDEKK